MFDFEKFPVYQSAEEFLKGVQPILRNSRVQYNLRGQLYRASSSILLNIAEGAGKNGKKDKRNFYTIARGSTYECVSIIKLIMLENKIKFNEYTDLYNLLDKISRMLTGLIKKMGLDTTPEPLPKTSP